MANPLIRTLNGWRFELPLALVLGASAAFATIAMPHDLFGRVPGVSASGFERSIQIVLAVGIAMIAAVVGYAAMKLPVTTTGAEIEEEDDAFDVAPIDIPIRLRRADAHPDFPPREPIRAHRDLGMPFMTIGSEAETAEAEPEAAPIPHADFTEVAEAAPVALEEPAVEMAPEPVAEATIAAAEPVEAIAEDTPVVSAELVARPLPKMVAVESVGESDVPAADVEPDEDSNSSIAAFAPEPVVEPAPRPERPRRESLAEMMERLAAGLDRRGGKPVAPPPAAMLAEVLSRPRIAKPEMRDALDELNRLAGRRD